MIGYSKALFTLLLPALAAGSQAGPGIPELFRAARFGAIVERLAEEPFDLLERAEQSMLIESLARTGEGFRAVPLLNRLLHEGDYDEELLTLCGIVNTSVGDLAKAEECLTQALQVNPGHPRALVSSSMLMLFLRNFSKAEELFERALAMEPELVSDPLFLLIGIKVRQLTGDPERLLSAYQALAEYHREAGHERSASRYEKDLEMLRESGPEPLFRVHTTSDRVELPMVDFTPGIPYKCLVLELEGAEYRIVLDTGNAPGWTVHDPSLLDKLDNVFGGMVSTSTGSVESAFDSRSLVTSALDFGPFRLSRLQGLFFPKPREAYFDGNLNPIFIQDRVVTMDYVNNRFLLRTKERFERDLSEIPKTRFTRVPFYGWEWPFVPVKVNGYADTLAMIETGAEDIHVKLEFARFINMPLQEAVKTFRGREYSHHKGNLDALVGTFLFHRSEVEVWPRRFSDNITGLSDSVMIGPVALEGTFIVHFDPFDNQVILQVEGGEEAPEEAGGDAAAVSK